MKAGENCRHGHALEGDNLYVSPKGVVTCRQCKKDAAARHKAKKQGEVIDLPTRELPNDNTSGRCWWCDKPLHLDPKGSGHCPVHVETNSSYCVPEKMNDGSHAALFFAVGNKKYDANKRGPLK